MATFQSRFRPDTVNDFLGVQEDQRQRALSLLPEWMRLSYQNRDIGSINSAISQYGAATMNRPRYSAPNTLGPTFQPSTASNPYRLMSSSQAQSFGQQPRTPGLSPAYNVAGRLRSSFRRSPFQSF